MEVVAPAMSPVQPSRVDSASTRLYLRLLERCLVRDLFPDQRYLGSDLSRVLGYSPEMRENGLDWPTEAVTMVGMKRLNNLEKCCLSVIEDGVPGDFVETGTWRGGCGILMRGVLESCSDSMRRVWLFDSFEGLPKPDAAAFPADSDDQFWTFSSYLGVSVEQVMANFRQYELLDDRVRFVKGWFRDTIPTSNLGPISVLRLDGDMYESTWIVLTHLYPKVSPGGFVVIDDYGCIPACKQAVDDFRRDHSIQSPLSSVDWSGVFWRKLDSMEREASGASYDVLQLEQKLHAVEIQRAAAVAEMLSALTAKEELSSTREELSSAREELSSAKEELLSAKEELLSALRQTDELRSKINALAHDVTGLNAQLDAERALRTGLNAQLEAERALRHNIVNSKSWRITAPLRRLMTAVRGSR